MKKSGKSKAKANKTVVKKRNKTAKVDMRAEYDFSEGVRGAVVEEGQAKLPITIRLDGAVLNFFREKALAEGGGAKYQTLINEALKEYIQVSRIEAVFLSEAFAERLSKSLKQRLTS
ncbi:MAG: BrnA antitoxin family protein [Pseudobdellovibrionaceae bacterium]|nr:BrnA antitoxin family protein [Pseudobdellovibrionaceae bacterium]